MLRFKSLGSGSTGNATLVEVAGQRPVRLLVDCGLGLKQLSVRLAQAGLADDDIDALFITHEHSDHIGCARQFARRYRVPVWMSRGTHEGIGSPDFDGLLNTARDGEAIDLGDMQIMPFTVPHDAREPLHLTCTDGAKKLGLLTDLGHATAHLLAHLARCDALLLECNHDSELLAQSTYPPFLKRRVGGMYGHLSNTAAGAIARSLLHGGLKHLVAAHLSGQNNRPELARQAMSDALGSATEIVIADAGAGTRWLAI
ncbi:MAG TPA: MBL fold metallo-hydrolase [Polaromonas sp.]|uniref:MBL fold metallo-hydrolase n=1 Tax=Polaromonas sp. UBA4122 TaxID=1947074 RepID=UPI000ECEF5CD|nr:MBL fold metallo-hydrolase [Polaromonas sp. UBA4122]HAL39300.1 MBL fold metallo-hydrolase [Polaromonas sp.]